jgi:iron complex outermembrane receptor protein
VQGELPVHDRLLLNLGLRHDQYDTFGGTTNPRVGVIYTATKTTTLKLLYGQAFRAPNAYELFWQYPGLAKANPTLQPETNQTSEVVLERTFSGGLRLTATGFYYRVRGLITQQTDPADDLLVYNNIETINAKGIELDVERKWSSGLEVRASHTLQSSRDQVTQATLTNSPTHLTQFSLSTPLVKPGLFAAVEMRRLSKRRTIAGNVVSPVFVPNVSLVAPNLPMGLELSASVFNMFNNQYSDPGSEEHRQDAIVQAGRVVRVKLTYRFARSK